MATEPDNVDEFQELARQALPKMYYDYYSGGAEDQHTLKENVEEFHRITYAVKPADEISVSSKVKCSTDLVTSIHRIRPRILVDVSKIDLSTTVLGYKISVPIMIAPTAMHKLAHPEGEVATARAAAACNTIMVYKRRDISANLVQRAERCGYKAIVLTVDAPRLGRRMVAPQLRTLKVSYRLKFPLMMVQIWKLLPKIHLMTLCLGRFNVSKLAAIKAVEVGVDGIVVSNHGARQLDYAPASISVLEEVVQVIKRKVPVLFDGGIRRGTDVFEALALGAQAVLIGRPVVYGLAAKGEYGVRRVVQILKDELELTMALSGCPTLKDISRNHVRTKHDRLHSLL
ncbi:hypothetical protein PTKIN_Ptkin13bG0097100 [Pterospermum kingtungense]